MDYQTPDLASILRTLSQAQNQTSGPSVPVLGASNFEYGQPTPDLAYGSRGGYTQNIAPYQDSSAHRQPALPHTSNPTRYHAAAPKNPQPAKIEIDPSTITTWAPALRYVTKLLGNNEDITERIRKLIKSQHDHEKQWAKGRELVVEERRKRDEGRNAINDVLRAIGGFIDTSTAETAPDDDAAILAQYDLKVHKACTAMVKSITEDLKTIGIPFFAVKPALLTSGPKSQLPPETSDGTSTVSVEELKTLQKRMLELLEDLCKD